MRFMVTLVAVSLASSQVEILKNPGFEEPLGDDNWECRRGCTGSLVSDSYTGRTSMKSANREEATWQGPEQALPLTGSNALMKGSEYIVKGYIKLLPGGSNSVETFKVTLRYDYIDRSVEFQGIVYAHGVDANDGWVELEKTFTTYDSNKTLQTIHLYIERPAIGREFLTDAFSLRKVMRNTQTTTTTASPHIKTVAPRAQEGEMLRNGGFEEPLNEDNWVCRRGCSGSLVSDSYSGRTSMKSARREEATWQGPEQALPLTGSNALLKGSEYIVKGYVKLLPGGSNSVETFKVTLRYDYIDRSVEFQGIVYAHGVDANDGWVELEKTFTTYDSNKTLQTIHLYIERPAIGREFLTDAFSLRKVMRNNQTTTATASPHIKTVAPSTQEGDMLRNGGFEEPLSEDNWVCRRGCSGSLVSDSYSGRTSMKSAGREEATWQGPEQALPLTGSNALKKGSEYIIMGYVKLLPGGFNSVETFKVALRYSYTDRSVEYQDIVDDTGVDSNDGWVKLEGAFTTSDSSKTLQTIHLYIEGPAVGREFLIDEFSLTATSAPEPTTTLSALSPDEMKNRNIVRALQEDF